MDNLSFIRNTSLNTFQLSNFNYKKSNVPRGGFQSVPSIHCNAAPGQARDQADRIGEKAVAGRLGWRDPTHNA